MKGVQINDVFVMINKYFKINNNIYYVSVIEYDISYKLTCNDISNRITYFLNSDISCISELTMYDKILLERYLKNKPKYKIGYISKLDYYIMRDKYGRYDYVDIHNCNFCDIHIIGGDISSNIDEQLVILIKL